MNASLLLAYSAVAAVAIVSPGPAVLLALRNGAMHGPRAVVWSSLGNVCGLFCLSSAAMLGLGALLMSSALLFALVKAMGAFYLCYVGLRHLLGRASALAPPATEAARTPPARAALYREAFWLAATNPKPILFFTALFPQFLDPHAPLPPQHFVLTGIFMALSFASLMGYALLAARARAVLLRPRLARWVNRAVGAVFVAFGVSLFALRRPAV